jgi:hypothetical protein
MHKHKKIVATVARLPRRVRIASVVLLFALAGYLFLGGSQAASFVSSVEAETGIRTGGASQVNAAGASSGAAVRFGTVQPSVPIQPLSWWRDLYDDSWSSQLAYSLPLSKSADSWDHYNLAYGIDGPTAMFRATDDTKYLDQALVYVNNIVDRAKPSRTLGSNAFLDDYLGWVSNKNGQDGEETPLYESYAWRYATRLLLAMKEQGVLSNPAYKAQYDELLAFSETHIFDKWYARGVNDYIYRGNTHMAAHWAFIASNLSQMTTDQARLAKANKIVDDINNHLPNYNNASLHGQMRPHHSNPAAYFWNENWGQTARPGTDVSHANGVIAYLVEAHDSGIGGWTASDMQKFVVLTDKIVFPAPGSCPEYVDGSGSDSCWLPDGFVKLGRYDAALQKRLESLDIAIGDQLYGNGALNAYVLGARE